MNKNIKQTQLKAIIIYDFLRCYNIFEKRIRNIFEENIEKLKSKNINQLYFVYGGKIATYIDAENGAIKLNEMKFKEKEYFKELTIIQLLKLNREFNSIDKFKFQFNSMQNKNIIYEFYDSAIKLINMRNILAHQTDEINFKSKDFIEVLSDNNIVKQIEQNKENYDITVMDIVTKQIYSNTVYLKIILSMLNSEEEQINE